MPDRHPRSRLRARDVLARMLPGGAGATSSDRRPTARPATSPTEGVVCPCVGSTVEDLDGVWARGFRELELVKRASLCGTGTCQGGVCVPHLRAFVADRSGAVPRALHGPAGGPADHPRRGRGRRTTSTSSGARPCTTSTSPRRPARPLRRLVAALELWRPHRRVLGRSRGGDARRRQHAGQAARVRARRRRAARAPLPQPRRTTSRRAARATCCCSTSAATSSTTA